MFINRNKFCFTMVTLLTTWLILIVLNYSSLVFNARSLAKLYIHSVNRQQQQLIPRFTSNENDNNGEPDEDDEDSLDIDLTKLPKQPEIPQKDEFEAVVTQLQDLHPLIPGDPDPSSQREIHLPLINPDPSNSLTQPDNNPLPLPLLDNNQLPDNPQLDNNPLPVDNQLPDNNQLPEIPKLDHPLPDNLQLDNPLPDNPLPDNPIPDNPLPENTKLDNPLPNNPPLPDNPKLDNPLPIPDNPQPENTFPPPENPLPNNPLPRPKRRGKRRGKRKGKSKPRKPNLVQQQVTQPITDLVQQQVTQPITDPVQQQVTESLQIVKETIITDLVQPVTELATQMMEVAASSNLKQSQSSSCNTEIKSDPESCKGRYIYIQKLPRRYNVDLIRDCAKLDKWINMCKYVKNHGLGPHLPDTSTNHHLFSESGWYATNQFLLELIFHNRMKLYDCLTNESSKAQAVFIPFYSGLDVAMHLWNNDSRIRDSASLDLVNLLKRKREWKRFWGRDHFFIGGRITWDFRRSDDDSKDPDWGTNFLYLPESKNMTALLIEASPWNSNDFAIPYPTYFHPSNDQQLTQWQDKMRENNRRYLFSFVGGTRLDRVDSIREEIITQCKNSKRCKFVRCKDNHNNKCRNPTKVMSVFQSSYFCLQPPGDSYTRRSTFDAILAGCIPVFFHPGSAYTQYLWNLPSDYTKYSIFISLFDLRDGKVSVEDVLARIPTKKVLEMRDEVVSLIPRVVYADPRCKLERLEDAFDLSVKGVLERIGRIKQEMKEGRDDSFGYNERLAWKYEWLGKERMQEDQYWDRFFQEKFEYVRTNYSNLVRH